MASYGYLLLDTLAPAGVTLVINSGAIYTATQTVSLAIGCTDADKTGYQMKIWGIDGVATEAAASWETYSATKTVTLTAGDGLKTVNVKLRDSVYNVSDAATATITLNTDVPDVNIQSQDVQMFSMNSPKDVCTITWYADADFIEYKIKVVPNINSTHEAGTLIGTTHGSTNMSGSGSFEAETVISSVINAADFSAAGAVNNEQTIFKIFVKNVAGTWSV